MYVPLSIPLLILVFHGKTYMHQFFKFLMDFLQQYPRYFLPWPRWFILSKNSLLWTENDPRRIINFQELLDCPVKKEPLSDELKIEIMDQFKILCQRVEILKTEKTDLATNTQIWYEILTNKDINTGLKELMDFCLRILVRDQNEGSVETVIGDIQYTDSKSRPRLKHETVFQQEFLKRNDPHPLLSKNFRFKALDMMFPEGWHFLVGDRLGKLQSTTVANALLKAKQENRYVFD